MHFLQTFLTEILGSVDNAVDQTRRSSPEGAGQEGNPVPVQIPAPAQMELGAVDSQSGVLAQPVPSNSSSQVLESERDFKKSHSESPGEIFDLAQAIPDTNVTVEVSVNQLIRQDWTIHVIIFIMFYDNGHASWAADLAEHWNSVEVSH